LSAAGFLGYIGSFEQSLSNIDRAIEIFTRLQDYDSLGMALAGIGRCFNARAGRLGYALELADRARQIAAASDNPSLEAWLAMEAEPHIYKGDWQRVIDVAEEKLPVALEIGNWTVGMYVCSWSALAHIKLNQIVAARKIFDTGLNCLVQSAKFAPGSIYTQIAHGSVLLSEGKITDALAVAETGRGQAEEKSLILELGAAHRVLGQINAAAKSFAEADNHFCSSLDILGEIQSQPEFAQSLLAYGRFQHKFERDKSMRLLKRALALFEDIGADGWAIETMAALRN